VATLAMARARWGKPLALTLTAVLLLFAAVEAWVVLMYAATYRPQVTFGIDARMQIARAADWLAGDGFYLPRQLAGPYVIDSGDSLYPPTMLYLAAPFALGLPMLLWWAVPLGIIAAGLYRLRPPMWAWPILAAILVYPRTWAVLVFGNPSMWALAALVGGMAWRWPAVGVAFKLTFAPLALIGVGHRSWWIAAGVAIAISLPFGAIWLSYVQALTNAENTRGFEYLLGEWPIALALLAAGISSGRSPSPMVQATA
jgi:hypothetical protein